MTHNPILEELYAAREKLLADVDGDIHKYLEGVRERQAASGRLLPPTPPQANECPPYAELPPVIPASSTRGALRNADVTFEREPDRI